MVIARKRRCPTGSPHEIAMLRARLAHTEDMIRTIQVGGVDSMVVAGDHGPLVFTLEGAEQTYRILIESMNEGALTLSADLVILYANQCFARMAGCPLATVMGTSFRRFLDPEDQAKLRSCLKPGKAGKDTGSKLSMSLQAADGSRLPVHLSIRPLDGNGSAVAIAGVVVTNLTEVRRTEDQLRALTHRVVQVQETERERLALELHDQVTQPLCATLAKMQALAAQSSGSTKTKGLRAMIGQTAQVVERISHDLRPSVLRELGLSTVLRDTTEKFTKRTRQPVTLTGAQPSLSLSADIELALYRILQEALKNIERHARSRTVAVHLQLRRTSVEMTIADDGVGFDAERPLLQPTSTGGLGLLGMHERATYVSGSLTITSSRGKGTKILVHIPTRSAALRAARI